MQDVHRVWFTLRSDNLQPAEAIAKAIGLEPKVLPRKEGMAPRVPFSMQSDLVISEMAPLEKHLEWLKGEIDGKQVVIRNFLSQARNTGVVLIYLVTQEDYGVVSLPSWFISFMADFDLAIEVKFVSEFEDSAYHKE